MCIYKRYFDKTKCIHFMIKDEIVFRNTRKLGEKVVI